MDASPTRGIHTQCSSNNAINNDNRTNVSYSQAAQREVNPTRYQAIVIDAVDGLVIRDYALAVGSIIGPQKMMYISRISQARVCIYLNSEETVQSLIETNKYIKIGDHTLEIRPLMSKSKRIIISNVHPIIPTDVLVNKFAEHGVIINSPITKLRSGIQEAGYTHLLSFRRQTYIDPEYVNKIPKIPIQIEYDSITYWIYVSTDQLACFHCKKEGHLAKNCKNPDPTQQDNNNSNITEQTHQEITQTQITDTDTNAKQIEPSIEPSKLPTVNKVNVFKLPFELPTKRALNASSTSGSTETDEIDIARSPTKINLHEYKKETTKSKPPLKKPRVTTDDPTKDVQDQLEKVQKFFTNNELQNNIDFNILTDFLNESYGRADIIDIASKYTVNTKQLSEMMCNIIEYIEENRLESRMKRLIKKLNNTQYGSTGSEDTSAEE